MAAPPPADPSPAQLAPVAAGPAPPPARGSYEGARLLWKTLLGLALLLGALSLLAFHFREPLLAIGHAFVDTFGGPGVMVAFFLPDAFALPIPHEAFSAFGLIGGLGFWEVVAWGSAGSLTGGSLAWYLGRRLGHTAWFARMLRGRWGAAHAAAERHGPTALVVGALSPLPYSVVCWAVGALEMRYRPFILWSLLRIPRIAFYLWLIQVGWIEIPAH